MNLLFLNAGRRCELVDSFRAALARRGGGRIHGSDIVDWAPALRFVDEAHLLPRTSSEEFVPAFAALCREQKIDLVLPTIDPDLEGLSRHRQALAALCPDTKLVLCPDETIAVCRDKRLSRERFASLGASVPVPVDPADPRTKFPIFTKPAGGSAGAGARVLRHRADYEAAAGDSDDAMFEEIVPGPEYTVDVMCDLEGRAHVAVPRRRIRVRGGEVSQGVVERNAVLESLAKKMAEGFGCLGPVTVQFRDRRPEPNGPGEPADYVGMEINARMGGGLPLSIAAGADWPGWILDLYSGRAVQWSAPITDGLMIVRYDRSVFIPPPAAAAPSSTADFGGLDAVVFDLDDTLYPERDFVFSGFRAVAARVWKDHGIDIEPVLRGQFDSGVRLNAFGLALAALDPGEDYLKELVTLYRSHTPEIRPFAGSAILDVLRGKGLKLGLVTDGVSGTQRSKIEALGLAAKFDSIVCSEEVGGRAAWKPSPLAFEACLRELGVDAARAVYIADNPAKDFRGARAAGMRSIRLRLPGTEHFRAEPLAAIDAPDAEVSSFTELLRILPK